MAAQVRTFSLPKDQAAIVDALAEREGGLSAAGQYIVKWFLHTVPPAELLDMGIEPPAPGPETPVATPQV